MTKRRRAAPCAMAVAVIVLLAGCGQSGPPEKGLLITDPARHVIANGDDISIGYGPQDSFPHEPGTYLLKQVMAGKSDLTCTGGPVKKQTVCLAPKRPKKA